jgi:hypothetical protein
MKQTAVEWLGYELNTKLFYDISPELWEEVNEIFNQAKEMEKEQIIYAAQWMTPSYADAEQYYNETFKS